MLALPQKILNYIDAALDVCLALLIAMRADLFSTRLALGRLNVGSYIQIFGKPSVSSPAMAGECVYPNTGDGR